VAGGKGAGGSVHAVAQQHGNGHRAHAAGHRRDALRALGRLYMEQAGVGWEGQELGVERVAARARGSTAGSEDRALPSDQPARTTQTGT